MSEQEYEVYPHRKGWAVVTVPNVKVVETFPTREEAKARKRELRKEQQQ